MLSQNLKKMRKLKGITQSKLADVLGVTQQAVARWERAKSEPDSVTLKQLSEYFNVSIDYLLDNEKNNPSAFNDSEIALVYNYRDLDREGRNLLLGLMGFLNQSHSKKSNSETSSRIVQNAQSGNTLYNSNGDNNLIIHT